MTYEEFDRFCASLPATTYVEQWGGAHVWKVGAKVFAICGWEQDEPAFTFKATPMAFEMMKSAPGLRPAPYLASRGLSWLQRMKLKLASHTLGHTMPTAALCYVWDNRHPVGTIAPNAYFSGVKTIVVQSGNAHAGSWQLQRRDLAADFRAAFGRVAPRVTGIALASDTDNTGGQVKAWFGDLTLKPAPTPTAASGAAR